MNIVIVGAGPIGMYFAIYFLYKYKNDQDIRFIFVEKRTSYTRNQIITVTDKYLPSQVIKELKKITKNNDDTNSQNIEIRYFEIILRNYLQTINNVYFVNGECTSVNEINQSITVKTDDNEFDITYDYLIGCDDSNSIVRDSINESKNYFYSEPFYSLLVFFKNDNANDNDDLFENVNVTNCIYLKTSYDISSVSINLNKSDYIDFRLNECDGECDEVGNDIIAYLEYIFDKYCDLHVLYNEEILDAYTLTAKPYFVLKPFKNNIFLLGDSMLTTHYFTGSGIENGFSFIKIFVDNFYNNPGLQIKRYLDVKVKMIQNDIKKSLTKMRSLDINNTNKYDKYKERNKLNKSPIRFVNR